MRAKMLLLPVAASLALLAGCAQAGPEAPAEPTTNGLENLSAAEIQQRVGEALVEAGSFRITGEMSIEGQTGQIDFVFSGGAMKGSAEVAGMGSVELILANNSLYLKGEGFLESMAGADVPAEVLALLEGKWISIPTGMGIEDNFDFSPDAMLELGGGEVTKGEVKDYEGQQVIELKGAEGTMLIALTGEPLPVAMVTEDGTVTFSDWGVSVDVQAPPAADVIDFMQLMELAMGGIG